MPIEVGFWKINEDNKPVRVNYGHIEAEDKLESIIAQDVSILKDDCLLLGRQVRTEYGKIIDLLTIDSTGKITIVELKRSKTPRDVVAQALDYASWVQGLSYDDIITIYKDYHQQDLEKGFEDKFDISLPEEINQEHDMLIVCSELDNETERILNYLSDNYSVPVNAVFFHFFKEGGSEYLSRSWLISPGEVEEKSSKVKSRNKSEAWNGKDCVVNIDKQDDGTNSWEDCIKYGFTAAGGGKWYRRTLEMLQPGYRVFAMLPKLGYLGVGTVLAPLVPMKDFMIRDVKGNEKSIMDVPLKCSQWKETAGDLERCEYMVRIRWDKTLPESEAYWEKGLRANQNSAFKLKNKFTLAKLIEHFGIKE